GSVLAVPRGFGYRRGGQAHGRAVRRMRANYKFGHGRGVMKRKHLRWLVPLAALIVLAGACVAYFTWPGGGVPSATWDVLDGADEWELYSLFPDTRNTELPERFGDWPVLGKTTVRDPAVRKRLRRALAAATPRYEEFNGANCFWP